MDDDIRAIDQNEVWSLADLPAGRKVIATRWVYHVERKANGYIERYNALFFAKGVSQKPGSDFGEIYAPVIKYTTLRMVLALVAQLQLNMVQVDVQSALLNGELEEKLYIAQPEGYITGGQQGKVMRLHK